MFHARDRMCIHTWLVDVFDADRDKCIAFGPRRRQAAIPEFHAARQFKLNRNIARSHVVSGMCASYALYYVRSTCFVHYTHLIVLGSRPVSVSVCVRKTTAVSVWTCVSFVWQMDTALALLLVENRSPIPSDLITMVTFDPGSPAHREPHAFIQPFSSETNP